MLSIEDFIISVYYYVGNYFREISVGQKLRSRGFDPSLSDSEVITMEIVGEYLGIDADKGRREYFRRHWLPLFPKLGSRPNFARQAANLWYWKQRLGQKFAKELGASDDSIRIADGLPIPVCHFGRAFFCKISEGEAAYGRCAAKGENFYGFRGHLLISFSGIITDFSLTPANVGERDALWELLPGIRGLVIGDKGYIGKFPENELLPLGIGLQTPFRPNTEDEREPCFVRMLTSVRRRVETVIGQL